MATITGIELGPNTCLIAAVRPSRMGVAQVVTLHRIDAADWPVDRQALEETLRSIRRKNRFPRRAAVVAWTMSDDDGSDSAARSAVTPLESAGFHIGSILTPPQALARLSVSRRRSSPGEAVAWLALNTHAAAIAIVRDGDLLYSRTWPWKYDPDQPTSKMQLLQRYTLVAHLAPELMHGIASVRDTHGLPVQTIVTCGNLPELRSLTMPLIEELDREVETLDSTEGLQVAQNGRSTRFYELAPALRLATAAALGESEAPPRRWPVPAIARVAAAIAVVATVAWAAYSYWHVAPTRPYAPVASNSGTDVLRAPAAPPARPSASASATVEPTVEPPGRPLARSGELNPRPVATQGRRETSRAPGSGEGVRARPQTMIGSVERSRGAQGPSELDRARSAVRADAAAERGRTAVMAAPAPQEPPALKEPLPRIDSVLIDQNRRLLLIGGAVVGVGDAIGSRVVVQIERDAVMLREPSGRMVRVRVRS